MSQLMRHLLRGAAAGADLTTNLLHYWRPAATLTPDDQVGANDGTPQGGLDEDATYGWNMGTDDTKYIELANAMQYSSGFTATMWAYPDKTAMDSNTTGGWLFNQRASVSPLDFQLLYLKSSGKWNAGVWNSLGTLFTREWAITHATWQLLGFSVGDGYLRVFTNGEQQDAVEATGTFSYNNTNRRVGGPAWATGGSLKYHGAVDEIRFYANRVLTEDEHAAIYALGH